MESPSRLAIRLPPVPSAILFDLDGTLLDSLEDIAEANNHSLELLGLPQRPIDDYRYLVGEGIPRLAERALGETHPWLVGRLAELTRARYRVQPLKNTRPYQGINEAVAFASRCGLALGVLSNKPHELTVPLVREFWPSEFCYVQGYVREEHRKPSPYHVLEFCRRVGQPPERVWLIGDTPTDLETGRESGAACISVTWGFRPRHELEAAGGEWFLDSPRALADLLKRVGVCPS